MIDDHNWQEEQDLRQSSFPQILFTQFYDGYHGVVGETMEN